MTEYNPVVSNYYNYKPVNNLETDIDNFLQTSQIINKINLCIYEVNNEGKYPFLKFLLTKDNYFENLMMPYIPVYTDLDTEQAYNYVKIYLFALLSLDNFDNFNENIVFNGFYMSADNIYLFIDITNLKLNLYDIYYENNNRFVLIDEIINHTHVNNIKIDLQVSKFFLQNIDFCFLRNENDEKYEIPIVGYVGKEETMLNFTYTFGETKKDKNAILGPYYYFTDFKNAVKDGCWSHNGKPEIKYDKLLTDNEYGRYVKGGIVRLALFAGNMKYIENLENDPIDESEIKKTRLLDETQNRNLESLTMRISDHDGKWASQYDSCYLGNLELDNGEVLRNTPLIVIRDYNQQIPLSYHFIRKSCLTEKYEEKKDYLIL
jgi:hypothetical protein